MEGKKERGVDAHKGPFCSTCQYAFFRGTLYDEKPVKEYECRRHSPIVGRTNGPNWPICQETHWCGDHQDFEKEVENQEKIEESTGYKNIEPFLFMLPYIRENWPDNSVMRLGINRQGRVFPNGFYGSDEEEAGFTVGQWRSLLKTLEKLEVSQEDINDLSYLYNYILEMRGMCQHDDNADEIIRRLCDKFNPRNVTKKV